MILRVYDTQMGSGGASVIPAISSSSATSTPPMLAQPKAEPILRTVIDQTASAPAAVGKLLVRRYTGTGDALGANFIQSATANASIPRFSFGVVVKTPPLIPGASYPDGGAGVAQVGGESQIVCEGPVNALVTTNTVACAAGTVLVADGSGNLTPAVGTPAAGAALAIAVGTLTTGVTVPTSTAVIVGGY